MRRHQLNSFKRLVRTAQNHKRRRATSKTLASPDDAVAQAHRTLVERATQQLTNIKATLESLASRSPDSAQKIVIEGYVQHAERQIGQIVRRVIQGETIPRPTKAR